MCEYFGKVYISRPSANIITRKVRQWKLEGDFYAVALCVTVSMILISKQL